MERLQAACLRGKVAEEVLFPIMPLVPESGCNFASHATGIIARFLLFIAKIERLYPVNAGNAPPS
jgi:hypothetical protein